MKEPEFKGITASEMAKIAKKTRQQISNYRKQGMPSVKHGHYYYFNIDSIQWLYNNGILELSEDSEFKKSEVEKLKPKQRKTLVEAKTSEFNLRVKKKELISLDTAKKNGSDAGIFVREIFTAFPDSFVVGLPYSEEEKHYIKTELKKEIYLCLLTISKAMVDNSKTMSIKEARETLLTKRKEAEKEYREVHKLKPTDPIFL